MAERSVATPRLSVAGWIAMIVGAIDPLEGSVLVALGSGLVVVGLWYVAIPVLALSPLGALREPPTRGAAPLVAVGVLGAFTVAAAALGWRRRGPATS